MTVTIGHLRDYFSEKWNISGTSQYPKARWSGTTKELVNDMVNAFGDFEVAELKTDELLQKAEKETASFEIEWDFQNEVNDYHIENLSDEKLKEYISDRLIQWADMAMGYVEERIG